MAFAEAVRAGRAPRHLPGEPGVWVFIAGDMLVFALLFGTFLYYRAQDPQLYLEHQGLLNQGYGLINTLLMLSSSWLVALAVQAARAARAAATARLLALALLCGAAFVVAKAFEWSEKIGAGFTITSNDFFMYYYLLTGIHLLHVLIGVGVLLFLWRGVRSRNLAAQIGVLESGASFWHLVDLLWIVLFPLLDLIH
ncbi:MAG: cytochrome c oxidase subunit 3 [Pseudomonadales bacterium]|nr:cytochrome c oxidase subunit 3 [Pseudomonadales bacterium]